MSDPKVYEQLRHLYEHPDFVELYPGIVAEDHKMPMVPGVVSNQSSQSDSVTNAYQLRVSVLLIRFRELFCRMLLPWSELIASIPLIIIQRT